MFGRRVMATAAALLLLFASLQVALANEDSGGNGGDNSNGSYHGTGIQHASSDEDTSGDDESGEMDDGGLPTVEQEPVVVDEEVIPIDDGPSTSEQVALDQMNEDKATSVNTTPVKDPSTAEQVVSSQAGIAQVKVTQATTENSSHAYIVTAAEQVAARQVKVVDEVNVIEATTKEFTQANLVLSAGPDDMSSVQVNNLGKNASKVTSTTAAPAESTATSAKLTTADPQEDFLVIAVDTARGCAPEVYAEEVKCREKAYKIAEIASGNESIQELLELKKTDPQRACKALFEFALCEIDVNCKHCGSDRFAIESIFFRRLKDLRRTGCKPYSSRYNLRKERCPTSNTALIILMVFIAILLVTSSIICCFCCPENTMNNPENRPLSPVGTAAKNQLSGAKKSAV